jgi:hypothetical protein
VRCPSRLQGSLLPASNGHSPNFGSLPIQAMPLLPFAGLAVATPILGGSQRLQYATNTSLKRKASSMRDSAIVLYNLIPHSYGFSAYYAPSDEILSQSRALQSGFAALFLFS